MNERLLTLERQRADEKKENEKFKKKVCDQLKNLNETIVQKRSNFLNLLKLFLKNDRDYFNCFIFV